MSRASHQERTGSTSAARAAIADPHVVAVYVVGPAGSGKSFLLDQLATGPGEPGSPDGERVTYLDAADRPLPPLRPSSGTTDLTLGALLPVLHRAPSLPPRSRAPTPRPPLLAIDDVDRLDESSLGLLGQAIDQHRIRLVATARSTAAAYVFEHLRIVGGSLVVTLEPWGRRDVDDFVARRLGGRVHTLTAARLLDFSGGNPLCVTELVEVGAATGSLRQEHGVWFSDSELRVPPVTAARVAGALPRLTSAAREVVDTVALAGPTDLTVLEAGFGVAAIEEADESGLLVVEWRKGRLSVAVRSTIESRVIVQRLSTTRRRRLGVTVPAGREAPAGLGPPGHPHGGPEAAVLRTLLATGPRVALEVAAGVDADRLAADERTRFTAMTGWCRLCAGDLDEARRQSADLRHRGVTDDDARAYQLGALLAGRCELAAGHAVAAQVLLGEAAVLRGDAACAATAEHALAPLALAHAMCGDDVAAVRTLDATRTGPAAAAAGLRASVDQLTRAEVLLEKGLRHAAAERAAAVAERSRATGQWLVALQALHLCARARPSARVAADVGELADRLDFGLARLHHRYAVAAAAGDATALADVAASYDTLGLRRLAGETAAAALAVGGAPRALPWAVVSRRLLHRVQADTHVAVPAWWWHENAQSLVLTDREREIAELAASGCSSPQIAERLQLSPRTVENHLQHAYRKLGIVRRDQLAGALRHPGETPARRAGAVSGVTGVRGIGVGEGGGA